MPAEWEPQEAVWLSWPSNKALWPGHYDLIPAKFAEFASAISRFEKVRINVRAAAQAEVKKLLNEAKADLTVVELYDHPTDDVWCRDHGPLFVKNDKTGEVAVTDWQFHGWGGKFEASLDNEAPGRIAKSLGMRCFTYDFELEGGGIEVTGDGLLLTTHCVQNNPNRATGRDDAAFHKSIAEGLAVDEILWIDHGLEDDDTDGHIDNLARFIRPDAIMAVVEEDRASPNYKPMRDNLEKLRALRTKTGRKFDIVELPLPAKFVLAERDLPPSYANFLIINDAVLVPVYAQCKDDRALGIIAEQFPGRKIVPIDCRPILIEGGALHCLSQQQPKSGK
jgi:agmatine deiminase